MEWLDYIFETAFNDAQSVTAEERHILYNYLEVKEFYRNSLRKMITGILMLAPRYLESVIFRNMAGTFMVDRDTGIEILCDYPLKREVKGITCGVVNST